MCDDTILKFFRHRHQSHEQPLLSISTLTADSTAFKELLYYIFLFCAIANLHCHFVAESTHSHVQIATPPWHLFEPHRLLVLQTTFPPAFKQGRHSFEGAFIEGNMEH